jgi:serine/threonine protein kinase
MSDSDSQHDLIDRLAEEFSERLRRGEQPSVSEYAERYPAQAEKLRELLPPVALIEQLNRQRQLTRSSNRKFERLGEYRIIREVGRGGMGIVYEAEQETLGRRVALKILPPHSLMQPVKLERFRREAQAAARLHHTNIVPVFGLFDTDDIYYYVMQFIPGRGLNELIVDMRQASQVRKAAAPAKSTASATQAMTKSDVIPAPDVPSPREPSPATHVPNRLWRSDAAPFERYWDQVAKVGVQAAEALYYAHQQGTLHRDIKPANLILDEQGTVWVTDFGLAKLMEEDNLTATGDLVGTLQYMAPESFHAEFDARSDIYALGLTLYELLTLESPFTETNPARLMRQVTEHEPTPPRRLNPAIPRDLETIILKAIARDPGHRYQTAREFADDLRRFLDDRPIQARQVAAHERLWRWCRRNRMVATLATTALASLLLTAVIGWTSSVTTARALQGESLRRQQAETATKSAEENMQMSLDALESIFGVLAQRDSLPMRPRPQPAPPPPPRDGPRDGPPHDGPPGKRPGPGERQGPPDGPRRSGPPHEVPPRNGPPHDGPPGMRQGPGERQGPHAAAMQEEDDAALLETVLGFYDRFAQRNATNPKLQREAAQAYRRVADLYVHLENYDQAASAFDRAASIYNVLQRDFPNDVKYAAALADVYVGWATTVDTSSDGDAAEQRLKQARKIADDLVLRAPNDLDYKALLARVHHGLGSLAEGKGETAAAEQYYRHAVKLQLAAAELHGGPSHLRGDQVHMQQALAEFLVDNRRPADAKLVLQQSIDSLDPRWPDPQVRRWLSANYERLSEVLTTLGETVQAEDALQKGADLDNSPRRGPPGGGFGPPGHNRLGPPPRHNP